MATEVTQLLQQWRGGDEKALGELMPLVYGHLRAIAGGMLRSERSSHTLSATAVVHELYLRLADVHAPISDRAHFCALSATVMRRILLDWAKTRKRHKRGGGAVHETLADQAVTMESDPETILEINRLLDRLEQVDPRKVKVVEMVFFGGMTYDESAEVLGISSVTVHRELKMAKAWMRMEMSTSDMALEKP